MSYVLKSNMVDSSKYGIKCPYAMTPQYITVHNTSNDASAKNEIAYMIGNKNQVSYHYAVDDIEVVQGVPENRNTWNAGDGNGSGNRKSIAIEICYSASGGTRFAEAEKNAAMFIAQRLNDLGWGIDRVRTHQSWSGKYCPHRTLDMGWQRFLNMVQSYMEGNTSSEGVPAPTPTPPASLKDLGQVDVTYQAYTDRWWPPVVNRTDWSGKGDNIPIRYLAVKVSKGSVKGRVYTQKSGWLPYLTFSDSYNTADFNNGCLGDGSPIYAVELYYYTPEGYAYKKIVYCVSDQNHTTFYPKQMDNEKGNGMDGYAGTLNTWIDKFQAWME